MSIRPSSNRTWNDSSHFRRLHSTALAAGLLAAGIGTAVLALPQSRPVEKAPARQYRDEPHHVAANSLQHLPDTISTWAFRPLRPAALPRVREKRWLRTPVDAFVLSALEARGIAPAPEADARTLIRRVTFDVTGLPPTPQEIDSFAQDRDPRAYARLVDRLLASPRYGERWGRRWLDLARYADSDGQESDENRPNGYHYRDFVIRSLNDDLPYNTFVSWQIAGDEYAPDNPGALSATGFLVAGTHANLDTVAMKEEKVREHYNELDDIVSTTGQAFLGLTIGCARCHDHKYDPIPTLDYYRLTAAFETAERREVALVPPGEAARGRERERDWKARLEVARKANDKPAVAALESQRPPPVPTAYAMADSGGKPADAWLLERGDFHRRKEPVSLGFISALCRKRSPAEYLADAKAHGGRSDTTYQRRALADWMTDTVNGTGTLLARVIVNRIWQGHFGEGIVRTVNDFGKRCDPPTHPALLEWLASELIRSGWRLKPVHRAMLLSAAYRQGAGLDRAATRIDPENRLLWRRQPQRMDAEMIRDAMLAAAGTLNAEPYGPAFLPPIQSDALQARNVKDPYPADAKDEPTTRRRSVYMFHKRVAPYPLLQAFDRPDSVATCGRRSVTTVATQALALMNEPFVRLRAREFADRLAEEAGAGTPDRVRLAFRLALGRAPDPSELAESERFINRQAANRRAREPQDRAKRLALVDFAQAVFALNEFIYID